MTMNLKKISVTVLMAAAVAAAWYPMLAAKEGNAPAERQVITATTTMPDFTAAAESTINGVVSIKSYASPSYSYGGFIDPFEFFFGEPAAPQRKQRSQGSTDDDNLRESGLGSGVIISDDGYIITNNHVIDGAEKLEVTLNDNRLFNATVVGSDPTTDLALIKIDATDLPVIPWGDSDKLKVGEWVLAVGNPFGLTSTVTTGIVSAKARSISAPQSGKMTLESYIQTDAAVNPGNSGGALVNLAGELVGINSAIYSQTGSYTGYSFAIPTAIVQKIATDLKEFGTVQRAVLGVKFSPLTPQIAKEQGITLVNDGLIIGEVVAGSTAEEAGLKVGDVIIAIDDNPTHNSSQLQEQIARKRPGDQVTVTYVRDNKKKNVKVTLYNSDGNTSVSTVSRLSDLGCTFGYLTDDLRSKLGITAGLQIKEVNAGPFADAGIKAGFIILEANNVRISSTTDLEKVYQTALSPKSDDHVLFIKGIYPNGTRKYAVIELTK